MTFSAQVEANHQNTETTLKQISQLLGTHLFDGYRDHEPVSVALRNDQAGTRLEVPSPLGHDRTSSRARNPTVGDSGRTGNIGNAGIAGYAGKAGTIQAGTLAQAYRPSAPSIRQTIPENSPSARVDITLVKSLIGRLFRQNRDHYQDVCEKMKKYDARIDALAVHQKSPSPANTETGAARASSRLPPPPESLATRLRDKTPEDTQQSLRQSSSASPRHFHNFGRLQTYIDRRFDSLFDRTPGRTQENLNQSACATAEPEMLDDEPLANAEAMPQSPGIPQGPSNTPPSSPKTVNQQSPPSSPPDNYFAEEFASPVPDDIARSQVSSFENVTIKVADMGEKFPDTLLPILDTEDHEYVVTVKDYEELPDLDWGRIQASIAEAKVSYELSLRRRKTRWFHNYPTGGGYRMARGSSLNELLNETIEKPPSVSAKLYNSFGLDQRYQQLLGSGEQISNNIHASGTFGSEKWHMGEAGSCIPLTRAPFDFWTCNLVINGYSLLVVIHQEDNDKLRELVKAKYASCQTSSSVDATDNILCDRWLSHLSVLLSPRQLHEAGIRHNIRCVEGGNIIIIPPKVYFFCVNFTSSLHVSKYFLLPGEPLWSSHSITCSRCPFLPPLDIPGHRRIGCKMVEQASGGESNDTQKAVSNGNRQKKKGKAMSGTQSQRRATRTLTELEQIKQNILELDPNCKIPDIPQSKVKLTIFEMAAIARSRPALVQFVDLVRTYRDQSHVFLTHHEHRQELEGDRLLRKLRSIDRAERKSILNLFHVRLVEFHLAMEFATYYLKEARGKATSKFLNAILEQVGWDRSKFNRHQRYGNKWKALCYKGPKDDDLRPGLLCFLMIEKNNPFGISRMHYTEKQNIDCQIQEDIHSFSSLLHGDYTDALCEAGEAFLQLLEGAEANIRFQFEREEKKIDWCNIPEHGIMELLKVSRED
ncbi:hypothetical protein ACHAPJ_009621 [Fusarium lateritium]